MPVPWMFHDPVSAASWYVDRSTVREPEAILAQARARALPGETARHEALETVTGKSASAFPNDWQRPTQSAYPVPPPPGE